MSRVKNPGNKFVNTARYPDSVYALPKKVRIHHAGEDYHKAQTLSQWLFAKYDMAYSTYRNKSKNRRAELRAEFESDTGIVLGKKNDQESEEDVLALLASIGVPFAPDGTPLGIGWD